MSSTNKTPNYQLPQFINSDVPSWLGDFNDAMSKIDTQMKANDTKATGASTNAENANSSATQALKTANQASITANGANTNATNALSAANTANDNANTAKQNAATALQTANSASGNASSALSMAQNANTNANNALNKINNWVSGTLVNDNINLHYNFNPDLKLIGFYGTHSGGDFPSGYNLIGTLPESFPAPKEKRTINFAGICFEGTQSDQVILEIDTNRNVFIGIPGGKTPEYVYLQTMVLTNEW